MCDNGIIWDAGVGCVCERLDQWSSYIDKSFNISVIFFWRFAIYSWDGGAMNGISGSF